MKILIDNGHGRETAGKQSPDGRLLEWAYNREIARRVVAELQAKHYYASLLVTEDEDISLAERCKRVNRVCSELGRLRSMPDGIRIYGLQRKPGVPPQR